MTRKTITLDLDRELRRALDWILEHRYERLDGSRWFSATDLERRLRAAAAERMDGKDYGSYSQDTPYFRGGPRFRGLGQDLLSVCRRFLFRQVSAGKLDCNNPGKGGCSTGMRFRPKGEELSASEQRGAARPAKKHVSHLKLTEQRTWTRPDGTTETYGVSRPACQPPRKPGRFVMRSSHPWYNDVAPTCTRCRRLLAKRQAEVAAANGLSPDAPAEVVHDFLEERGL